MSDRVAYDTWVQANQRCLVGEFDRLKARLTGGESAETAGHNIDEIDAEGPAQAAIDVLSALEAPHWSALTPVGPLRRWRLVELDESPGVANARLRIDERVLHYLAGVNYLDPRLRPLLRTRQPGELLAVAHRQTAATILSAIEAGRSSSGLVRS